MDWFPELRANVILFYNVGTLTGVSAKIKEHSLNFTAVINSNSRHEFVFQLYVAIVKIEHSRALKTPLGRVLHLELSKMVYK